MPSDQTREDRVMKIDGGCHCGYIAYEAEVDPEQTAICHCTDCQTLSGSAFRTVIPAPDHSFRILSGEPAIYVKTGESGAKRPQDRFILPQPGHDLTCIHGLPLSTKPSEAAGIAGLELGGVKMGLRDRLWAGMCS